MADMEKMLLGGSDDDDSDSDNDSLEEVTVGTATATTGSATGATATAAIVSTASTSTSKNSTLTQPPKNTSTNPAPASTSAPVAAAPTPLTTPNPRTTTHNISSGGQNVISNPPPSSSRSHYSQPRSAPTNLSSSSTHAHTSSSTTSRSSSTGRPGPVPGPSSLGPPPTFHPTNPPPPTHSTHAHTTHHHHHNRSSSITSTNSSSSSQRQQQQQSSKMQPSSNRVSYSSTSTPNTSSRGGGSMSSKSSSHHPPYNAPPHASHTTHTTHSQHSRTQHSQHSQHSTYPSQSHPSHSHPRSHSHGSASSYSSSNRNMNNMSAPLPSSTSTSINTSDFEPTPLNEIRAKTHPRHAPSSHTTHTSHTSHTSHAMNPTQPSPKPYQRRGAVAINGPGTGLPGPGQGPGPGPSSNAPAPSSNTNMFSQRSSIGSTSSNVSAAHSSHSSHPSHPSHSTHQSHSSHGHPRPHTYPTQPPSSQQPTSTQPPTVSSTSNSTTSNPTTITNSTNSKTSDAEHKSRKENFLMFTRVLMKYLEQKDKAMHSKAKAVIRECAEKNKQKDPNYTSLSASMQSRLKQLVGPHYWKKAEEYLSQFLKAQYMKQNKNRPGNAEVAKLKARELASKAAAPLPGNDGASASGRIPSIPLSGPGSVPGSIKGIKSGYPPHPHTRLQPGGPGPGQPPPTQSPLPGHHRSVPPRGLPPPSQPVPPNNRAPSNKRQKSAGSASKTGGTSSNSNTTKSRATPDGPGSTKKTKGNKKGSKSPSPGASRSKKQNNVPIVAPGNKPGASNSPTQPGSQPTTPTPMSNQTPPSKTQQQQQQQQQVPPKELPPPKEYEEWMDQLTHMTEFDVKLTGLFFKKSEFSPDLSEEQRKLLDCGDVIMDGVEGGSGSGGGDVARGSTHGLFSGSKNLPPYSITSSNATSTTMPTCTKEPEQKVPPHLQGTNNVITASEAAVRLKIAQKEEATKNSQWSLPGSGQNLTIPSNSKTMKPERVQSLTEKAGGLSTTVDMEDVEDEEALALLSEATQMYVKTLLEGALNAARKRMNLDGIRLWHQQHIGARSTRATSPPSASMNGSTSTTSTTPSTPTASSSSGTTTNTGQTQMKNPLYLRLGCDVHRQYALAEGNAAKTCQRMEEALSRQPEEDRIGHKRKFRDEDATMDMNAIMYEATSMADVAKYPKLPNASKKAKYDAGKYFEVYGGKDASKPPLGRIPKEAAYITTHDLKLCLQDPAFSLYRKGMAAPSFV